MRRCCVVLQDVKWLQRGQEFAAFMMSEAGRGDWNVPDHPSSLFEGLAGGVCLLAELQAAAAAAQACDAKQRAARKAAAGMSAVQREGAEPAAAADVQLQAIKRNVTFPLFELSCK